MTDPSPFTITIYDKAFKRKGWVTDPIYATFTPRFNAQGTGEIQCKPDDPMLEFLLAKGARVRVEYRGRQIMSGPIRAPRGAGGDRGTVTLQVQDDWRILPNTLAWVVPGPRSFSSGYLQPEDLNDGAQTFLDTPPNGTAIGYGYFVFPVASGELLISSSESVVKHLIGQNARNRLGRPVTIAPNLDRGGDAYAANKFPTPRFDPLDEALADLLEWSGLGVSIAQDPALPTINVDVWEPKTWPQVLTVASGILSNPEWALDYPEATRVVVGGPGELTARAFWGVNDATGLEADYGDIVEVFRDATGAGITWPASVAEANRVAKYFLLRNEVPAVDKANFRTYLDGAAAKGLTEGRPTAGVSVELSETESFYFGGDKGIQIGDLVRLEVSGMPFEDRVTSCVLSWDADDGLSVRPQVGQRENDPDEELASAVSTIMQAVRRMSTSK